MVGFFKYTHSTCGATHKWELAVQRGGTLFCSIASPTSPGGTHPCAQAIIVNDKVTIEVIIVLN